MRRLLASVVVLVVASLGVDAARADVESLVRASGASPFALNCNGAPQTGTLFRNAEVEPWVDSNPDDPSNLIAVWQQDRWSNGGSQGNVTAYSFNRGRSWTRPAPPPFTRCAGGTPANGGAYERASDPWVSFSPNGDAHQIGLAVNDSDPTSAILVSSSRDGGAHLGPDHDAAEGHGGRAVQRQGVDHRRPDQLAASSTPSGTGCRSRTPPIPASPFSGDTLFSRSTDGGRTWEPTRTILDFPDNSNIQTLGNQIVVLGDGTLVNVFDLISKGRRSSPFSGRPTVARRGRPRSSSTCSSAARFRDRASSIRATGMRCGPATCSRRPPPTRAGGRRPCTSSGRTSGSRWPLRCRTSTTRS